MRDDEGSHVQKFANSQVVHARRARTAAGIITIGVVEGGLEHRDLLRTGAAGCHLLGQLFQLHAA